MQLEQKVRAVERIFLDLEKAIALLSSQTQLACFSGCGKCCEKPDIYAAVLEFLPWAHHAYLSGNAELLLEQLEADKNKPVCFLFNHLTVDNTHGLCSDYRYRGLICRLFGFSVMKHKDGGNKLITCKRMKEEAQSVFEQACQFLQAGGSAPVAADYYGRLRQIDLKLTAELLPINKALLQALKEVMGYYAYRKPPMKRSA